VTRRLRGVRRVRGDRFVLTDRGDPTVTPSTPCRLVREREVEAVRQQFTELVVYLPGVDADAGGRSVG